MNDNLKPSARIRLTTLDSKPLIFGTLAVSEPLLPNTAGRPALEVPRIFPLTARHHIAAVRGNVPDSPCGFYGGQDHVAANTAIRGLLAPDTGMPDFSSGLHLRRDPLGKPFVEWTGATSEWARSAGWNSEHLHISNTHDGGAHMVIAAYGAELAGIGIDAVWLPRLRQPHKDRDYLLRFARRFMCEEEWEAFASQIELPYPDINASESLRHRAAAHFSLMEAASKACGTGLKVGIGMGKATSLPKQSLGALRLTPDVELYFDAEAQRRLAAIGAVHFEAHVHIDAEFLVSVVALYRQRCEKERNRGRRVAS